MLSRRHLLASALAAPAIVKLGLGTAQAAEAIKLIAGIGTALVGKLVLFDVGSMQSRTMTVARNPECPSCGTKPRIRAAGDRCGFRRFFQRIGAECSGGNQSGHQHQPALVQG